MTDTPAPQPPSLPPSPQGRIITFYSYKGGTGRSMALANVAWILASNKKRVLVIDWDLEAPGLNRYFHPYLPDKNLTSSPGLMEFVMEYVSQALTPEAEGKPPDWYKAHADIVEYAQSLRWSRFEKPGTLDLIPAGRQNESYSSTVNLFNWQQFYDKLGGGAFFDAAKEYMCAEYDYILIDSRTGVSDTSGICTIQMPDTVVLCFTFNIQSIEGASAVAETIEHARQTRNRDIRILPVPTRVDESEKEKVDLARIDAWRKFDRFLCQMTPEDRANYWGAIEIPYRPWYAFEEVLSTFGDRPRHQSSMLAAMETLTSFITNGEVSRLNPITEAERLTELAKFVRHRTSEPHAGGPDAVKRGEQALARLPPALQEQAIATIVRLANITDDDAVFTSRRLERRQLGDVPDRVLQTLRYAELITETRQQDGAGVTVELSNPEILRDWTRARRQVEKDRPFLIWRQALTDDAIAWAHTKDRDLLLRGDRLTEARRYVAQRAADFNPDERKLVDASVHRRRTVAIAAMIAIALPIWIAIGIFWWIRTDSYQIQRVFADAVVSPDDATPASEDATEAWIRALVDAQRFTEAHAVADSPRDGVQRAGRAAVLASAFHHVKRKADADAAVVTVTAALKSITDADDRTRAKVRVAKLLSDSHPLKAKELLFDVLQAATDAGGEASHDQPSPAKRQTLISTAANLEKPDPGLIRLGLFRDVILTMREMERGPEAASALRDADAALRDVGPRQSVAWLLDLLSAVDGAPYGDAVAAEAREKVLQTIAMMPVGPARESDLLAAVKAMTNNGRGHDLVVERLRNGKFTPSEMYGGASIAFRAITRWRTAATASEVWANGAELARRVGGERHDLLTAVMAAARAACGDMENSERVAADLTAKYASSAPAKEAAVLASVSEIYCSGGLDAKAREFRQRAVQQALLDSEVKSQSAAIAATALVAARCGDVAGAARTSQGAGDPEIVQQTLPELVAAMADAAGAETDAGALASAKTIVVTASQIEERGVHDATLMTVVRSLIRTAREGAAIEVAKGIDDDTIRSGAVAEIAEHMKAASVDELYKLAGSIEADSPRARARIAVGQYLANGARPEARSVLAEAERDTRRIGDAVERSEGLRDIAIAFAAVGDLRSARGAAVSCADSSDQLRGFAAIVTAWNRQRTRR